MKLYVRLQIGLFEELRRGSRGAFKGGLPWLNKPTGSRGAGLEGGPNQAPQRPLTNVTGERERTP